MTRILMMMTILALTAGPAFAQGDRPVEIFSPPLHEESYAVNYLAIQPGVGVTAFPRVTLGAVFRLGRSR